MVQLSIQNFINMDRDARARDLTNRAELFRNRKLGQVRRRLNFGGQEGRSGDNSPHSLAATMNPNMEELNSQQAKDLQDKYNFNFLEEEEKEGPFEWEKVVVPSSNVPDFYVRPPHRKKVRQISPELLPCTRTQVRNDPESSFPKDASSPNGSNDPLRLTNTPVTRQLFCPEKETENEGSFTAIADNQPESTVTTSSSALQLGSKLNIESGYGSFHTGISSNDLTRDSIENMTHVDTQGGSSILHKPIAVNGGKTTGQDTKVASPTRNIAQGNHANCETDSEVQSERLVDQELVNLDIDTFREVPGDKTPPHQVSSSISSEVTEAPQIMRDETPSTSGLGSRKRKGEDIKDYFPEKKKSAEKVRRKVFDD